MKRSIVDDCVEDVRRRIATGQLAPGDRLPAASTDALLRAYRKLKSQGVLEDRPGYGTYVPGGQYRSVCELRADAATESLRSEITSGRLAAGTPLPVKQLAKQLRTTRLATETAIARLAAEGLTSHAGPGARVAGGEPRMLGPKVEQAVNWIRTEISSGRLTPGAALPSARQIATAAEVSRLTVTAAVRHLKNQGEIVASRNRLFIGAAPVETPNRAEQISQHLRNRIAHNFPPGSKLPNYAELSEELGVGTTTISRAFARLKAEGLVEARGCLGSFVSDTPQAAALRAAAAKSGLGEEE